MLDKIQQGWRKPNLISYLLLPLSFFYRFAMSMRTLAYATGLFKSSRLSVPVIVVGGISVGGSGKTPLVMAIVEYLKSQGYRPGVLSRGYGGDSAFWPRQVGFDTGPETVGDEPRMIFERCAVPVVVGPDRRRSGLYLIDKCECNVLVSDDGFQHLALKRDVDIVVVDGEWGFGNGWCLPSGPLREPVSSLKRADAVVSNGKTDMMPGLVSNLFVMESSLSIARNLSSGEECPLKEFNANPVHAVAAVGNPNRFFAQLEKLGLKIMRHPFPDHHQFVEGDFSFSDDTSILMTEKDGIKCRNMKIAQKIWIVPAKIDIDAKFYAFIDGAIPRQAEL